LRAIEIQINGDIQMLQHVSVDSARQRPTQEVKCSVFIWQVPLRTPDSADMVLNFPLADYLLS